MTNENSEARLVEQPAIELFGALGYQTINAYHERAGRRSPLGRETTSEVVLVPRLQLALRRLNPAASDEAIRLAIEELTRSRAMLSLVNANREIYGLLRDGVKVSVHHEEEDSIETLRVIDWERSASNDFLLVSQFWITGQIYKRRTDLIGFVNGLPLVFCEFKTSHRRVEDAYHHNLRDYKQTIPQLFWYNAFIILSNGTYSRIGSLTAGWEHYFEWKKISDEEEEGVISLETMIRGTCEKARLLDLVENFTLFSEVGGELRKILGRNHQYLGVNNALAAVRDIRQNQGRLGVFWHTQGSGKSLSMVFFTQKVLRKIAGNWTFVIITDRDDLDNQIYKTFASAGAVVEEEKKVRANSGEHLKQLLRENHRTVFTLIQKFRVDKGQNYPLLSERADIVVITDEAHRTQYDTLARNMRSALPNAAFLGFTGTPLMAEGEEETKAVFGDYVSIYNFRQSIEDGITVPLYYENRIPELQLTNATLNEEMEQIIEAAGLDEQQEKRLEREFAREYHLLTNDDRLEKIAEDIVAHFMGRGQSGKAMVVSLDKKTALRMYNKVQSHWLQYRAALEAQLATSQDETAREELAEKIASMRATDMALVVSQSQNEIEDFGRMGLDILPHRQRMIREDLEQKFKDADDPLRIVFVCAMWMTGFDVPSLSTIYLDKPMRNHTLMQTIARANRVFQDKVCGLIVDYVGVFRNLKKALAIYASGGGIQDGDMPVQDKEKLFQQLKEELAELIVFCQEQGVDLQAIVHTQGFQRGALLAQAEDALLVKDETKKKFIALTRNVSKLYQATLPHTTANTYTALIDLCKVLVARIQMYAGAADISGVMSEIEQLVDTSIATRPYIIRESAEPYNESQLIDLSKIDFEALRAKFATAHKHTEVEKLRGAISRKLTTMVQLNKTRTNYQEKFQRLIDEYNAGSSNIDLLYQQLLDFVADELNVEEKRHIAEQLSEEELAVFDLLTRPDIVLSESEKENVKKIARDLLATLKKEKLVLDWRKKQQARAEVRLLIENILDLLPASYTSEMYDQQCEAVYQHIYDSYAGMGRSIYSHAS